MNKNVLVAGTLALIVVVGAVYWFVQSRSGGAYTAPYGANDTTSPAASGSLEPGVTVRVSIKNLVFNPASVTVKKGDSVIWTNNDPMAHTITGNNGGPSSDTLIDGGTYQYKFDVVGTFEYHCGIHPSMEGMVTVTE